MLYPLSYEGRGVRFYEPRQSTALTRCKNATAPENLKQPVGCCD
jgi:hypothetical protein